MLIPEAWQGNDLMEPEKKAFYNWAACLQEPWDGPALFTFSDGRYCGANLDRNGLRPCRYIVTNEDIMVCASEVGAVFIPPEKVVQKGRLKPNLLEVLPERCHRIFLPSPILTFEGMNATKNLRSALATWPSVRIDITFPKSE